MGASWRDTANSSSPATLSNTAGLRQSDCGQQQRRSIGGLPVSRSQGLGLPRPGSLQDTHRGIAEPPRLQHNSPEIITACMDRIGLQYQPANLSISRPELASALSGLRSYIEARPDLWYTIIDEREIEPEWIDETLAPLRFSVR